MFPVLLSTSYIFNRYKKYFHFLLLAVVIIFAYLFISNSQAIAEKFGFQTRAILKAENAQLKIVSDEMSQTNKDMFLLLDKKDELNNLNLKSIELLHEKKYINDERQRVAENKYKENSLKIKNTKPEVEDQICFNKEKDMKIAESQYNFLNGSKK